MAVNPRITPTSDESPSVVVPPTGVLTPPVAAVVLVDGAGNILATTDIGGGLATLDTTGGGGGGGGDASAANQVLEIAQLTAINAGVPVGLGQTAMAAAMSVVVASDQSAVPVSGTVAVTGVATAANQATANASLASIDGGTPAALGQTTMAASMPVVLASDQSTVPVSGTVGVTGVATAANQATEISSLASIDAGTPAALGQTTMAASMPVALASNQSSIPVAGDVAAASADSGNPVKIAGKLNTAMPTYTDGQRGDLQIGTRGSLKVQVMVADGSNALVQLADNADAVAASATVNKNVTLSRATVYNGATWDRLRVPTIIKTAVATASGNTALWTPTGGTKFRVMRAIIMMSSDAATAGGALITIDLQDTDTTTGITASVFVPAVAGTAFGNGFSTGWMDFGHGKLSAAANNVLNIDLSAALTSGTVRVIVAGVEE